jgi:hypothetical protein
MTDSIKCTETHKWRNCNTLKIFSFQIWVNFSLILPLGSQSAYWLTTICYNVIITLEKGAGNTETCFNHVSRVVCHRWDSLPTFVFTAVGYSHCSRWHCIMNCNFVALHERVWSFCESSFIQYCKCCSWVVPWDILCLTAIRLLPNLPAINFRNWRQNYKCVLYHGPWAVAQNLKFVKFVVTAQDTLYTHVKFEWRLRVFLCWPT